MEITAFYGEHRFAATRVAERLTLGVLTDLDEALSFDQTVRMVKLQNGNRYSAFRCERHDLCAVQSKVIEPLLCSRIKKGGQLPAFGIERSQVRAFVAIAIRAGQRQIVQRSRATVLLGDDVLHLKGQERSLKRV